MEVVKGVRLSSNGTTKKSETWNSGYAWVARCSAAEQMEMDRLCLNVWLRREESEFSVYFPEASNFGTGAELRQNWDEEVFFHMFFLMGFISGSDWNDGPTCRCGKLGGLVAKGLVEAVPPGWFTRKKQQAIERYREIAEILDSPGCVDPYLEKPLKMWRYDYVIRWFSRRHSTLNFWMWM